MIAQLTESREQEILFTIDSDTPLGATGDPISPFADQGSSAATRLPELGEKMQRWLWCRITNKPFFTICSPARESGRIIWEEDSDYSLFRWRSRAATASDFWQRYMEPIFRVPERFSITNIGEDISEAFQIIPEVKAIYVERYRYEFRVSVLLSIKTYDDKLMDRLLDVEYKLTLRDHGDFLFDFHYLPDVASIKHSIIHPDAIQVFAR
jgi:hypothetical protein